jgi:hypothetical protein
MILATTLAKSAAASGDLPSVLAQIPLVLNIICLSGATAFLA